MYLEQVWHEYVQWSVVILSVPFNIEMCDLVFPRLRKKSGVKRCIQGLEKWNKEVTWEMILNTIQKDLYENKGTSSLSFQIFLNFLTNIAACATTPCKTPTHSTSNTVNFKNHKLIFFDHKNNYLKHISFPFGRNENKDRLFFFYM